MATVYTFTRAAGPKDWRALPRQFAKGETVFAFAGHDYGAAYGDWIHAKKKTVSCSLDGSPPPFTVPVDLLCDESGAGVAWPFESDSA